MSYPSIKKVTYESKFDRKYACFWKRGARKIKKANRKHFRQYLKQLDSEQESNLHPQFNGRTRLL